MMSTFKLGAADEAIFFDLYNIAKQQQDIEDAANLGLTPESGAAHAGAWTPLYDWLESRLASSVELDADDWVVHAWIKGARNVNANLGFQGAYIRERPVGIDGRHLGADSLFDNNRRGATSEFCPQSKAAINLGI